MNEVRAFFFDKKNISMDFFFHKKRFFAVLENIYDFDLLKMFSDKLRGSPENM